MLHRLATVLLPLTAVSTFAAGPLRVACVGDSITYGDRLSDRETQSYPAVLERLSQGRFAVGNFGVNGATALQGTGRAWSDTSAGRDALAFSPDLVVVMLGINDLAFPDRYARYPADLRGIVQRFQALPSAPRVFLCTLTPIAPVDRQAPANQAIRETMNPAVRAVAAETGAAVIDIAAAYPNRLDLLPDGLHPSPAGAELIARAVRDALDSPPAPQIQPAPAAGPVDLSIRHEAQAAERRAAQWLKNQPPPADLQDPRGVEDPAPLLPLLAGLPAGPGADPYFSFAQLAFALDRAGQETVFLADGRPVSWRNALLHELVQRQRLDARGGGFWVGSAASNPTARAVRDTTYALQALAIAAGP